MAGFLAYIIPVDAGRPDQGLPSPPLGTWGGVGQPYPDQGLPGNQPYPDQGLPGQPPYPSQGPGFPTHPIAPGGQPPHPSQGPGFPTPPIYIPITPPPESGLSPEHPIYIPVYPSQGPGFPTPPIALPPGTLTPEEKQKLQEFLTGNLPPAPPHPEPVGRQGPREK